ncbi:hypothetical protein [Candidatus Poriferisodalis sp.]|uniref:hypothetical protein n=1 Tax=Candidatus Poriferisodalis sp. TaxID=3101277 RepID=UPI003B59D440
MIVQLGALAAVLSFAMLSWPRLKWQVSVRLAVQLGRNDLLSMVGLHRPTRFGWWWIGARRRLIDPDHRRSANSVRYGCRIIRLENGVRWLASVPRVKGVPAGDDKRAYEMIERQVKRSLRRRLMRRTKRVRRLMDAATAR